MVQRAPGHARAAAAAAAPGHQGAGRPRRPRAAVPDGAHRARRCRPSRGSTSPARCSTSCGCGGRRRSCAPSGSSARSARRRASTSRTSRSRPRARTSRTPRCRRRSTTRPRASTRLATETGAGQWGTRAGVRVRAVRPRVQGLHGAGLVRAEAVPPDPDGDVGRVGRAVTGRRPDHPGSLGLAISDAVRDAAPRDDTHYSLGSVLNHVLLHQTVIGLEAKEQLALAGEARPDVVIGCVRRRLEPRRHRAAVRARRRRAARRGRAVVVPDAHRGHVRLRLRRHRGHDAAAADVHARPRLRAAVDPRRRAALPRRLADHLAAS